MGLLFQIQAIINLPLYSDTSLMHIIFIPRAFGTYENNASDCVLREK